MVLLQNTLPSYNKQYRQAISHEKETCLGIHLHTVNGASCENSSVKCKINGLRSLSQFHSLPSFHARGWRVQDLTIGLDKLPKQTLLDPPEVVRSGCPHEYRQFPRVLNVWKSIVVFCSSSFCYQALRSVAFLAKRSFTACKEILLRLSTCHISYVPEAIHKSSTLLTPG